jgi:hypothetical protein
MKTDHKETGFEEADWIHVAEDRVQWRSVVNKVMNFRVEYKVRNFLTSWATINLSRPLLHEVT